MNYNGNYCPHCNSEDISGDSIEPDDAMSASRDCSCNDCDSNWIEILTVTGYDNLNVPSQS